MGKKRAPARQFRWSIHDIAAATGKGVWSVRKDRQRGLVDLKDLLSLSRYIIKCRGKAGRPDHDSEVTQDGVVGERCETNGINIP